MTSSTRRGRRSAFFLGAASLLVAELVVVGVTRWSPPQVTVDGVAYPVAVSAPAVAKPSAPPPVPKTSSAPPVAPATQPAAPVAPVVHAQPHGSIRLPDGGTATMVRKDLGADGSLPVPENLNEATWWGASLDAPSGASVFAGHVNWGGATGPFAELWSAKINAPVTIVDSAGKTWTYRISQVMTLDKDELPQRADELFSQAGAHRIVLVTCGGEWVGGEKGYNENRVAIADPA
jgi:hypothetical protein